MCDHPNHAPSPRAGKLRNSPRSYDSKISFLNADGCFDVISDISSVDGSCRDNTDMIEVFMVTIRVTETE